MNPDQTASYYMLKDRGTSIKETQSTKWPVVSSTLCLQQANMLLNNFKYFGTYCTDKHYFWHIYSLKWWFESLKFSNSEVVYKYDFQKKKFAVCYKIWICPTNDWQFYHWLRASCCMSHPLQKGNVWHLAGNKHMGSKQIFHWYLKINQMIELKYTFIAWPTVNQKITIPSLCRDISVSWWHIISK